MGKPGVKPSTLGFVDCCPTNCATITPSRVLPKCMNHCFISKTDDMKECCSAGYDNCLS